MIKNKFKTKKSIIIIIALLFILVNFTFAWFTIYENTKVNNFSAYVIKTQKIEVSKDAISWGYNMSLGDKSVSLIPIAGSGVKFFERELVTVDKVIGDTVCSVTEYGDYKELTQDTTQTKHLKIGDMYLRSSNIATVYFDVSDSYVKSLDEIDYCTLGAMRVSLVKVEKDSNGEEVLTPIVVWFPNSTYHMIHDASKGTSFTTQGREQSKYLLRYGPNENDMTEINFKDGEEQITVDGVIYIRGLPTKDVPLFTIQGQSVPEHYRMFVWLDGEDPECDNPIPEDAKVSLKFVIKAR